MKCNNCGADIKEDDTFCWNCGNSIVNTGEDNENPALEPEENGDDSKENRKVPKKGFSALRIIIIAICILMVLAAVIIGVFIIKDKESKEAFEKQLSLGTKYLEELKYDDAIIAYKEAIKIEPKNEQAYIALAELYQQIDEPDKAEEILQQGLEATRSDVIEEKVIQNESTISLQTVAETSEDTYLVQTESKIESETESETEAESEIEDVYSLDGEIYYQEGLLKVGDYIFIDSDGKLMCYWGDEELELVSEINPALHKDYAYIESCGIYYADEYIYYGYGTELRCIKYDGTDQQTIYDTAQNFELLGVCSQYIYFSTEVESFGYPEYRLHIYNLETKEEKVIDHIPLGGPFKIAGNKLFMQPSTVAAYQNMDITCMDLDGSNLSTLAIKAVYFNIFEDQIYAFVKNYGAESQMIRTDLSGNNAEVLLSGLYDRAEYIGKDMAIMSTCNNNWFNYTLCSYDDTQDVIAIGETRASFYSATKSFVVGDQWGISTYTEDNGMIFNSESGSQILPEYDNFSYGLYNDDQAFYYAQQNAVSQENGDMNEYRTSFKVIRQPKKVSTDMEMPKADDTSASVGNSDWKASYVSTIKEACVNAAGQSKDIYVGLRDLDAVSDGIPELILQYSPFQPEITFTQIWTYLQGNIRVVFNDKGEWRLEENNILVSLAFNDVGLASLQGYFTYNQGVFVSTTPPEGGDTAVTLANIDAAAIADQLTPEKLTDLIPVQ